MTLVAFEYLVSLKRQVLNRAFSFKESEKDQKVTALEKLGKGFTRQSIKLLIHLGNHMKTKEFMYCSQSSRMMCSMRYGL